MVVLIFVVLVEVGRKGNVVIVAVVVFLGVGKAFQGKGRGLAWNSVILNVQMRVFW